MRDIDIKFWYSTYSFDELTKLKIRKTNEVSRLDNRASKNAAKSRTKLLYDLSAISAALYLVSKGVQQ